MENLGQKLRKDLKKSKEHETALNDDLEEARHDISK